MADVGKCPICGSIDDFEEGERVDVGFGSGPWGVKVGPDCCRNCEYIEGEHNFEHYVKCWELMISPHPVVPTCVEGNHDPKYKSFFQDRQEAYGNCYNQCLKMAKAHPELRIVHGFYMDWIWGEREHFWCVDENDVIVDPTKSQFPTQCGSYVPKRYFSVVDLESKLSVHNLF